MLGGAVYAKSRTNWIAIPALAIFTLNAALDITVPPRYSAECGAHSTILCAIVYHCVPPPPPFAIVCLCLCLCVYLLFFSRRMNAVVGAGWRWLRWLAPRPSMPVAFDPLREPFGVVLAHSGWRAWARERERETDGGERTSPPLSPLHQCPLHHQTSPNITSGPSTLLLLYGVHS